MTSMKYRKEHVIEAIEYERFVDIMERKIDNSGYVFISNKFKEHPVIVIVLDKGVIRA